MTLYDRYGDELKVNDQIIIYEPDYKSWNIGTITDIHYGSPMIMTFITIRYTTSNLQMITVKYHWERGISQRIEKCFPSSEFPE